MLLLLISRRGLKTANREMEFFILPPFSLLLTEHVSLANEGVSIANERVSIANERMSLANERVSFFENWAA